MMRASESGVRNEWLDLQRTVGGEVVRMKAGLMSRSWMESLQYVEVEVNFCVYVEEIEKRKKHRP